jgi:cell division protease FtsH
MCATLGGRAAEEIIFGEISTGALSDLEKVTKQAQAIVTIYGLNDKLGNISYYDSTGQSEYSFGKPYSEHTAQVIDQEISKIVEKAYVKAKEILSANKEKLIELAEALLEKEVIFKEDLEVIFGKRQSSEEEENEPEVSKETKEEEVVAKEEVNSTETDSKNQSEEKEEAPIEEQNKDENSTT